MKKKKEKEMKEGFPLTYQVPVLPSYRNQSIDLHSKLIDWFYMRTTLELNGLNQTLIFQPSGDSFPLIELRNTLALT